MPQERLLGCLVCRWTLYDDKEEFVWLYLLIDSLLFL